MRIIIAAFVLVAAAIPLVAEPIQFQSSTNRSALLELYSSEGCSSCPPAEAWLSRLTSSPRLWKDLVVLAFHVDYWDHLGWRDPFATAAYSERQRAYASRWQSRSVYTPGFVLDGNEWRGWFNRDALPGASSQWGGSLTAASEDGKRWTLHFEPSRRTDQAFDFHSALLGFDLVSEVKAGENRGRKLEHDFVVLATDRAVSQKLGESFVGEISLASPSRVIAKRLAVAVWVTRHDDLQPVQALGGWLRPIKE